MANGCSIKGLEARRFRQIAFFKGPYMSGLTKKATLKNSGNNAIVYSLNSKSQQSSRIINHLVLNHASFL